MARAARAVLLVAFVAAGGAGLVPAGAPAQPRDDARFATFNASLNRASEGRLVRDLSAATTRRPRRSPRSSSAPALTSC